MATSSLPSGTKAVPRCCVCHSSNLRTSARIWRSADLSWTANCSTAFIIIVLVGPSGPRAGGSRLRIAPIFHASDGGSGRREKENGDEQFAWIQQLALQEEREESR